jgi:hypothetical protein
VVGIEGHLVCILTLIFTIPLLRNINPIEAKVKKIAEMAYFG